MPYYHHRIDASSLRAEKRTEVWNLLAQNSDIHTATPSNPGVFEVFLSKADLQILDSPILVGCTIEEITQEIDI